MTPKCMLSAFNHLSRFHLLAPFIDLRKQTCLWTHMKHKQPIITFWDKQRTVFITITYKPSLMDLSQCNHYSNQSLSVNSISIKTHLPNSQTWMMFCLVSGWNCNNFMLFSMSMLFTILGYILCHISYFSFSRSSIRFMMLKAIYSLSSI